MNTIIVTGVAGFIGSHVAERLLEQGNAVIGIDSVNDYYSPVKKRKNIALLERFAGFTFIEGDICNEKLVNEMFVTHKPDYVAHLAARAGVRPSIIAPLMYEEANIKGTLVLLEACKQYPVKNFVLTSSSSVYGNSKQVPFREDDNATDFAISPYAASKKATEVFAYSYHHLYKIPVNVIRPFTVYGPRGRPDMAPWIFLEATVNKKPIARYGDGTTRRDYTYVGDFVSGFVSAIFKPFGYEIFNLGNSATVSLSEALATISTVTQMPQNIVQHPMQPGDVEVTYADISKARAKLGYDPKTSFREGMQLFYNWYLEEVHSLETPLSSAHKKPATENPVCAG